ncbi:DUF2637 domain-containing protein [Microbispora sp. H13382]|uniref:DUF2637 domain-containing protein n=1 Tax=Microbispora sp. H13382 TaxID=2729112 RepID=UPI00160456D0|nr:DUF2637 domain-containing protein [Microbispora sp. H13382]
MTRNFTRAVAVAACVVVPLVVALAVLGGIGSFATLRRLAEPWFGPQAWIVPIGIDLGILALLAWDLLMEGPSPRGVDTLSARSWRSGDRGVPGGHEGLPA